MVILGFQFSGDGLGEGTAAGGHEDGPAGAIGVDNVLPAAEQRVCLHHGPTASAVGVIVHLHLLVGGVGTDLMGTDGDIAPLLRPAQDADVQHGVHGFREQGQNVDLHVHLQPLPDLDLHPSPVQINGADKGVLHGGDQDLPLTLDGVDLAGGVLVHRRQSS